MIFFIIFTRFRNKDEDIIEGDFALPESYNFLQEYPECDFGPLFQECGCCYAYGPIKSISHRICKKTKRRTILSSQFIVSCDLIDNDCLGGCERSVFYFLENHGVTDVSCHPWQNKREYGSEFCHQCYDRNQKLLLFKTAYGSTKQYTTIDSIKRSLIKDGPLSGSIVIGKDFSHYKGGLYTFPNRNWETNIDKTITGNHSIEIIGWGKDDTTKTPYWLISNHYGRAWGENGTMKIPLGVNEAKIESFVYGATPIIPIT